jgi:hypothetical protein
MGIPVKRLTLTLLACAVAAVAAACGSASASIPPPQFVEKSAAIAAGDGVCTALAADQQKLIDDFKAAAPQAQPDEIRDFLVNTLTPRIERAVGDFHRIGEPTKDKPAWNALVSRLDTDVLYFKAMIRENDPTLLLTIKPFARDAARFDAYGFKECGKVLA